MMLGEIFWAAVWILVGATFSESIRAVIRKVTKGRFFGPVPASEPDTLDLTKKVP
jgi:hypothetical protein